MTTSNPTLPPLTPTPALHPHSCVSLSLSLLHYLNALLPPPSALTISIGSGRGLLEALLLHHNPSRRTYPPSLLGIEVRTPDGASPVNRYLPEENCVIVPGTWAVAKEVEEAEGLMFVYPRDGKLVERYLEGGGNVRVVVWIGPGEDEGEMCKALEGWGVRVEGEEEEEGMVLGGERVRVFVRR